MPLAGNDVQHGYLWLCTCAVQRCPACLYTAIACMYVCGYERAATPDSNAAGPHASNNRLHSGLLPAEVHRLTPLESATLPQVFLSKLSLIEGDAVSWLPLLRIPLMDSAEQQLVLEGFNESHVPYDTATLVHDMFANHAWHNPEAPCLIFAGCMYSYAEVST